MVTQRRRALGRVLGRLLERTDGPDQRRVLRASLPLIASLSLPALTPHGAQEDLTPESIVKVLDDLAAGKKAKTGPQSKRKGSEPDGPLTALNNIVRRKAIVSFLLRAPKRESPRDGD